MTLQLITIFHSEDREPKSVILNNYLKIFFPTLSVIRVHGMIQIGSDNRRMLCLYTHTLLTSLLLGGHTASFLCLTVERSARTCLSLANSTFLVPLLQKAHQINDTNLCFVDLEPWCHSNAARRTASVAQWTRCSLWSHGRLYNPLQQKIWEISTASEKSYFSTCFEETKM